MSLEDEVLKGLKIGKVYIAQADNDDIVGCAIAYGPGALPSDIPSTRSKQEMDELLPAEQKEFLLKVQSNLVFASI